MPWGYTFLRPAKPPETSQTAVSNSVYISETCQISLFWHCFDTVLLYLALFGPMNCIWDPGNCIWDLGYEGLRHGIWDLGYEGLRHGIWVPGSSGIWVPGSSGIWVPGWVWARYMHGLGPGNTRLGTRVVLPHHPGYTSPTRPAARCPP